MEGCRSCVVLNHERGWVNSIISASLKSWWFRSTFRNKYESVQTVNIWTELRLLLCTSKRRNSCCIGWIIEYLTPHSSNLLNTKLGITRNFCISLKFVFSVYDIRCVTCSEFLSECASRYDMYGANARENGILAWSHTRGHVIGSRSKCSVQNRVESASQSGVTGKERVLSSFAIWTIWKT